MGYSTDFTGELKFTRDLKGSELLALTKIFKENCRDHDDWPKPYSHLTWMDLCMTDDLDGIKWNGSEKTSPMEHLVNVLIDVMQRDVPDFALVGEMRAQGEEIDDRWTLKMVDNVATKIMTKPLGAAIMCPHCEGKVYVDEAELWSE